MVKIMLSEKVNVFLDDVRDPHEHGWRYPSTTDWVLTKTPKSCIALLDAEIVNYLSLDHDLGDDERIGTGYDVLKWLEERVYTDRYFQAPRHISVHSANVSVRKKMEQAIKSNVKRCEENVEWVLEANP